jgi:lambda family phage minor tail protein L
MSIQSDIQKPAPGAIVELYVLDATSAGDDIYRFHSGLNELGANVVWQGVSYVAAPVKMEGFELRGSGTAPRPKLSVANIAGVLGAAVRASDDLVGAKVTRKRTFARYLDAVNFAAGNPIADPNVHFNDDVYYIDRKSSENRVMIEWELVSALDLVGTKLPRRQIIANICSSRYRSAECSYTGGAVADITDVATGSLALDQCGKKLNSCKLRFGANAVLPYGAFPAAGLVRTS